MNMLANKNNKNILVDHTNINCGTGALSYPNVYTKQRKLCRISILPALESESSIISYDSVSFLSLLGISIL